MTNIYHATPYDISATGFYFSTYEDYLIKAADHRNESGDLVEEYEIQFIDGDNFRLFGALCINQANLQVWFDEFEHLAGDELLKAIYLAEELSYPHDDILHRVDDLHLFEGTATEYADSYLEDTGLLGGMPESLRCYFDADAFARDLVLGGDIAEFRHDGLSYVVQGSF